MQQLADANRRGRKIATAAAVAAFNGWTLGVFAALSTPFAIFSIKSLVVCVGLWAVTWNEFRGRRMLRRFDPRGPRVLGWGQLGLMALLTLYSAWQIYTAMTGQGEYAEVIRRQPELASQLGSIDRLYTTLTVFIYGGLIGCTMLFQGLNSAYYFTRTGPLRAYLQQTPPWVVQLQRSGAMG